VERSNTEIKIKRKTVYVTCGEKCFKLTKDVHEEVGDLLCTQEEAATRMLLHAKHAVVKYSSVVLVTEDTDVFVIAVGLSTLINSSLFIRRGTSTRVRLVDITKVAGMLGNAVCTALLGLHPWTGCDTVSALSGQGKLKAVKLMTKNDHFLSAFSSLGTSWKLSSELFTVIEEFTCRLYCSGTKVETVNELRYEIFRAKQGNVESSQLPPCRDSLFQHTLRANYQAAIWRQSLIQLPDIPDPTDGHGWSRNVDASISIHWMTGSPAPDIVLALIACKCARYCVPQDCSCIINGLKCTAACKLQNCTNTPPDDDDLHCADESSDSSDSKDDEFDDN